jgi:hypothetical protein
MGTRAEGPPGGRLDLPSLGVGILEGVIEPCPQPGNICPFLGCENDCSGNGVCVAGACQCYVDWQGSSCASPVCGAAGGDGLCQALHGAGAVCDLDLAACVCSKGAGPACSLPDPRIQLSLQSGLASNGPGRFEEPESLPADIRPWEPVLEDLVPANGVSDPFLPPPITPSPSSLPTASATSESPQPPPMSQIMVSLGHCMNI